MNDFVISKSHSLFIDRDGVINRRIFNGYVTRIDEFEFLPGVLESFEIFNGLFNKIIVVTNQQGVGKGLMSKNDLEKIHSYMIKEIENAGGRIDALFYCTDLKEKPENCRKPSIYMAQEAKRRFPDIDFSKSVMTGDSESDILFGKNAGMKTVLIGENILTENAFPDEVYPDLISFARSLKKL